MISTTWWPSCGRRTTPTKWLTSSTRAVRVEAARAAAKLEAAHELKEAVRAGFESPAREAAAAATDRRAAAQDRTERWPPETVLTTKESWSCCGRV